MSESLKCHNCQFFLKFYPKGGSMPTSHNIVQIDEPFVRCTKLVYALASRVHECRTFIEKNKH